MMYSYLQAHSPHLEPIAPSRLRRTRLWPILLLLVVASPLVLPDQPNPDKTWAIAIHGGAGEAEWLHMDDPTAAAYHASLARALAAGAAVLQAHGAAIDAVQAAVEVLEDDPLFNAGRGSGF